MDRLSFVFSLLLIVSVTTITFGSVIKAKNRNGESLEEPRSDPDLFPHMALKSLEETRSDLDLFSNTALKELGAFSKRFHHQSNPDMKTDAQAKLQGQDVLKDQEGEMSKRDDAVKLIPEDYQIAICIENQSGHTWERLPGVYFIDNSTIPSALRLSIKDGESALASSYGKEGVGGVLEYQMTEVVAPLAVMYRADSHHIAWSVMLNEKRDPVNERLYYKMFDDSYEATDDWTDVTALSESLLYRARMSDYPRATLEIQISKPEGSGM